MPVQDGLDQHDLPPSESEQHQKRLLHLNPACLALAVLDGVGHDRVTYRLEISCFDRVGLPVVKEATHVLPDSVSTDGLDGLMEGLSNHEDHVGVEIGETRAEVAGGPAVEDPTNTVP